MKRILVWDLPIRLFHWLLAVAFIAALVIANVVSDHDAAFGYHVLLGLVMGFMVLLRVIWGFVGTRWARFRTFAFGPRAVLAYFKGALTRGTERHVGHNPGSSVAIFAILLAVIGLVVTGVLAANGVDAAEDLHGLLAYLLLAAAIGHVLGLALHTWRHREPIALSMISGKKEGAPASAIRSARPLVAVVFLVLTGLWGWRLAANYDTATGRLTVPVIGEPLQLVEARDASKAHAHDKHDDHDADDDDD